MSATEIAIIVAIAIASFCMGYVVRVVNSNGMNGQLPTEKKPMNNNSATIQKVPSTKQVRNTICFKCKRQYQFEKSMVGKTKVICPYCFAKGIIGE